MLLNIDPDDYDHTRSSGRYRHCGPLINTVPPLVSLSRDSSIQCSLPVHIHIDVPYYVYLPSCQYLADCAAYG